VKSNGGNIALNISIEKSVFVKFTVESETEHQSFDVERVFLSPDVQREKIEDEFVGELFYSTHSIHKTIILLGGSDGSQTGLSLMAGPLASRGFNVLTVGYFNEQGLPPKLEEIPLEYFEHVFSWLKKNPVTQGDSIYLHGTSKGGELALLLASRYREISRVVVSSPHAYCLQALDGLMAGNNASSWSYKGKSLPFISVDNNIFYRHQKECIKKGIPFGFTSTYKTSVDMATNKEEARIKIENAYADFLFIAGRQDNVWNTYEACASMISALENNHYKYLYTLLDYEELGHSLPIPYIIPLKETLHVDIGEGVFTCGGTLEGNSRGQADSWEKTLQFFMR